MAELGFVGDGPNSYQVYLGGNAAQTAMAEEYKTHVKVRDLEAELEPLFVFWRNRRREGEGFGYFVARVGINVRPPATCCGCAGGSEPCVTRCSRKNLAHGSRLA